MTIGFDASRAFVENRTGTENYSFQLLKALAKIDTKDILKVYVRPGQESLAKKQIWPKNFTFYILHFTFLWTQVGLALQTFKDKLDVLFIPAHTLPLIRKPGLKTVVTVHDLGAEYLPGFHQLKQVLYLKLMTHFQLKSASQIIAVSEATKKDLIDRIGINSKKIEVVYEGVGEEFRIQNLEFKIELLRDILKQFGVEKGKYFLFVGTIQPRKNIERLIQAFKKFLDSNHQSLFKLILVGGRGWKSDDIYELPKKLGIESQVKFTGRISDQELYILYSSAAALTYPSLFEGFGLPILEAFSCKCPVITSNLSSMPEVAGDAAVLINPESEEEITKAMLKMITDDKFRNILIQRGSVRLKDFSWKKAAIETIKVLTKN